MFACFPAGTPVATKSGLKNIEEVEVGDEVWAYDENSGELGLKPVINTFNRTTDLLVKIEIDGEIITATPEHPFYANGDWKAAGLLETGDAILLFSGKLANVKQVKYEGAHAPIEITETFFEEPEIIEENSTKVFNFEVKDWHTYFVGWLGVLVHNAAKGICLKAVLKEIKVGKKKLREILLGRTPGKGSKTGKEVFDRMKNEVPPRARIKGGKKQYKDSKGNWRDLKTADMAHKTDAVKWWNSTGKNYKARSKQVRDWMLDSKNYDLDHYSLNRSAGAKLKTTYQLPKK